MIKPIIRPLIRTVLVMISSISVATVLHELYHVYTLKSVSEICLVYGGDGIAYVKGKGESNELVAYIITYAVIALIVAFAFYDLYKEEG